jgi:hypothetical protein
MAHATSANFFPSPATVPARVAPVAPGRYAVRRTVHRVTCDELEHAQELLGHSVPCGEPAQALDGALESLIASVPARLHANEAGASRCRPGATEPRGGAPSLRAPTGDDGTPRMGPVAPGDSQARRATPAGAGRVAWRVPPLDT